MLKKKFGKCLGRPISNNKNWNAVEADEDDEKDHNHDEDDDVDIQKLCNLPFFQD